MIGHVAVGDVRREMTEVLLGAVGEGRWRAAFETIHTENTYPRLPIRDATSACVSIFRQSERAKETQANVSSIRSTIARAFGVGQ